MSSKHNRGKLILKIIALYYILIEFWNLFEKIKNLFLL